LDKRLKVYLLADATNNERRSRWVAQILIRENDSVCRPNIFMSLSLSLSLSVHQEKHAKPVTEHLMDPGTTHPHAFQPEVYGKEMALEMSGRRSPA
jgi:hypothetical protein